VKLHLSTFIKEFYDDDDDDDDLLCLLMVEVFVAQASEYPVYHSSACACLNEP